MDRAEMTALQPEDFPHHAPMTSRWTDNDMYGHLNNSVYFQYFDSAINRFLTTEAGTDPMGGEIRNVVAESGCTFLKEAHYPTDFMVGLRVEHVGRTSTIYRLALFSSGATPTLHAVGRWVHVFIDTTDGTPTPIPEATRRALLRISTDEAPQ
ncbi:thioesterase family protein [Leifsonia bigeumensis]|uniref:Thioesterase family protein n=1 Tax=Leifsonella bigeumensis TaxID=433643 RepID=A0ABP7F6Q9_9MICO